MRRARQLQGRRTPASRSSTCESIAVPRPLEGAGHVMDIPSDLAPQGALSLGAEVVAPGRLTSASARRLGAAAGPSVVAVTLWLALSSGHLQRPLAAALYWGYLI